MFNKTIDAGAPPAVLATLGPLTIVGKCDTVAHIALLKVPAGGTVYSNSRNSSKTNSLQFSDVDVGTTTQNSISDRGDFTAVANGGMVAIGSFFIELTSELTGRTCRFVGGATGGLPPP